jgi:Fe(3+) dicitrate transport protein
MSWQYTRPRFTAGSHFGSLSWLASALTLTFPHAVQAQEQSAVAQAQEPSPGDASQTPVTSPPALGGQSGEVTTEDVVYVDAQTEVESNEAQDVEVTVAGTPLRRAPGSAQVITERELSRHEYDDAHAVLSQVPGVYVRTEDGMGLRPNIGLRGVNPERSKKVTLLEDGVLFGPAPYSAPAAYFFPLMTRMTSVRVIKGPGAVSYGPQTVGGTIDLVSRSVPTTPTLAFDTAVGQRGYIKAHAYVGSSTERTGVLIEGVHLGNNGFKVLPNHTDTGFSRNEWVIKANHVLDPYAELTHKFSIKLGYADELSNESYLGLSEADFAADPNRRYAASNLDQMTNHRTSVVISHELENLSGLRIRTDAYRHDYERSWRKVNGFRTAALYDVLTVDSPRTEVYRSVLTGETDATNSETLMIGPNHRTYVSQGLQSVATLDAATGPFNHKAQLGLRYHFDQITRRHSQDSFALVGGEPFPDGGPTEVTASNRAFTHAVAVSVVDAISWNALTLTPGFRTEIVRSSAEDFLTGERTHRLLAVPLPGVGLYYDLTYLGIVGGVYRGFSPPEPGSSSSVKPESSWNYEFGARSAIDGLNAEVMGFYNDYGNMTDVCTFATGCTGDDVDRQFSAGEARIYGVEALAKYDVHVDAFTFPLAANYTWTRGEFANSFSSADPIFGNVEARDELPYVPRHQWRFSVAAEHTNGSVFVAGNYVSAMREEAGRQPLNETVATESLFTMDVGATLSMGHPFEMYANVNNVLNEQKVMSHRPFGARPNAPRWIHAGLKAKF